jgi:hypothetical protein
MAQNTIDEFGRIISKDRLTHDQSWKWSSGTSINSRVQKELLQACQYGVCIRRLINWAIAARQNIQVSGFLQQKSTINWLTIEDTPLCDSPPSSNATSREQSHDHLPLTHLWRCTLSI